jgi:hypothetical protein
VLLVRQIVVSVNKPDLQRIFKQQVKIILNDLEMYSTEEKKTFDELQKMYSKNTATRTLPMVCMLKHCFLSDGQ